MSVLLQRQLQQRDGRQGREVGQHGLHGLRGRHGQKVLLAEAEDGRGEQREKLEWMGGVRELFTYVRYCFTNSDTPRRLFGAQEMCY